MFRTTRVLLAAIIVGVGSVDGADDAPSGKPAASSESLLSEKGLKLVGWGYVLKDQEERDRQLHEFEPLELELDRLEHIVGRRRNERDSSTTTRSVEVKQDRKGASSYTTTETVSKSPAERAADQEAYESASQELVDYRKTHAAELRRRDLLIGESWGLYMKLLADPEVIEAMWSINRTQRPKRVIGSVRSPTDYRECLEALDLALLARKGVGFDPGSRRLYVKLELENGTLATQVEQQMQELAHAKAKARLASLKRGELTAEIQAATAEVAQATPDRRQQAVAKLEQLQSELKRLPAEDVASKWEAEFMEIRSSSTKAVQALRERIAEARDSRRAVEADADVRSVLRELRGPKAGTKIAELPSFHHGVINLPRFEKAIGAE
jgi:hypothetical protein